MGAIILVSISFLLWVALAIKKRHNKRAFYTAIFISGFIILLWSVYFGIFKLEADKQCALAAVVFCCHGMIFGK